MKAAGGRVKYHDNARMRVQGIAVRRLRADELRQFAARINQILIERVDKASRPCRSRWNPWEE